MTTIHLSPTSFWSSRFVVALVLVASVAIPLAASVWMIQHSMLLALALIAATLAAVVLLNAWRPDAQEIVVGDDGRLVLPVPGWFGRHGVTLQQDSLYCLDWSPGERWMTIGAVGYGPFRLHRKDLADADLAALDGALRRTAGERLRQADVLAERARRRPVIVGTALPAALVVIHLGVSAARALEEQVAHLFVIGGLNGGVVASGEFYRLVTTGLLHGSVPHLATNCAVLWFMAWRSEYLWETRDYLTAFLFSVVCGALLASFGDAELVVGASGGISGLFGLYVYRLLRRPYTLPAHSQFVSTASIVLVGLTMMLMPLPRVSLLTHAGGFLGGLLIAPLLDVGRPRLRQAGAMCAAVVLLAAIGAGLATGREWVTRGPERALQTIAARPHHGPMVHLLTWFLLQHPATSDAQLRTALGYLQRADLDDDEVHETWARAWLRLGDLQAAVASARQSLVRTGTTKSMDVLLAAQRALLARNCRGGQSDSVEVRLGTGTLTVAAERAEVHLEIRTGNGRRWYLALPSETPIDRPRIVQLLADARSAHLVAAYEPVGAQPWSFSALMLAPSFAECAPRVPITVVGRAIAAG